MSAIATPLNCVTITCMPATFDPTPQQLEEVLNDPVVAAYLADVKKMFRFKWQFKILPWSKRPASVTNEGAVTVIFRGLLPRVRIYLSTHPRHTLKQYVLHELAHVHQFYEGYTAHSTSTPFEEHDCDNRLEVLGVDAVSETFARYNSQPDSYFMGCPPKRFVRGYMYGDTKLRRRLKRLGTERANTTIATFLDSRWADHGQFELWDMGDLNEAVTAWHEWERA